MIFPTTINGIPCKCQVTHFIPATPMKVYGPGMGDADPPEQEEFDFKLLDRRGRRATWLDRYISPAVEYRLLEEAHIMRQAEDFYA